MSTLRVEGLNEVKVKEFFEWLKTQDDFSIAVVTDSYMHEGAAILLNPKDYASLYTFKTKSADTPSPKEQRE